jgi:hypothetical protein
MEQVRPTFLSEERAGLIAPPVSRCWIRWLDAQGPSYANAVPALVTSVKLVEPLLPEK